MDTKEQLLVAAERAARERGYDGFSYADLAASVGIKKASIHYHFPTKAELALALVARYRLANGEFREHVDGTAASPADKLRQYIAHYRRAVGDGDMLCLCVSLSISPDRVSEQVREALNGFHEESIEWLRTVLEAALHQGQLVGGADPSQEASALLALVEGAQLRARAAGRIEAFDSATACFTSRLKAPSH